MEKDMAVIYRAAGGVTGLWIKGAVGMHAHGKRVMAVTTLQLC